MQTESVSPLYARTPEELTAKVEEAKRQIETATFRLENPTVKDYAEKWLKMHEAHVRDTTCGIIPPR